MSAHLNSSTMDDVIVSNKDVIMKEAFHDDVLCIKHGVNSDCMLNTGDNMLCDAFSSSLSCLIYSLSSKDSSQLWRMILGHPSTSILTKFLRLHDLHVKHVLSECSTCVVGKSKTQTHKSSETKYTTPLEHVQIDSLGLSPYTSSSSN